MFFIGIFGTGQDKKEIKVFNNIVCPLCGRWTRFRLVFFYSYFHFFFIPLFKFRKRYVLLPDCGCPHFEADKEYFEELKSPDVMNLDFSRLTRTDTRSLCRCPACGRNVEAGFSFCPYCGARL